MLLNVLNSKLTKMQNTPRNGMFSLNSTITRLLVGNTVANSSKEFSVIFLRDMDEPAEIKSRIETTKANHGKSGLKMVDLQSQGKSTLAKMLSTIVVGDFTSNYLAVLHGVDPTPVEVITHLKGTLQQNGFREKIIKELEKILA